MTRGGCRDGPNRLFTYPSHGTPPWIADAAPWTASVPPVRLAMSDAYLAKLRFLVVEDNPFMRTIIRRVLGTLNVGEVREANNGAEGLTVMQTYEPDIIIVDWEMEPVDGIEFIRMVRTGSDSQNPFVPIIMVTAHSERARVITAREAGVTEFVVKPMSAKTLYDRIEAVIERPRRFVRTKTFFGPDRRRHKGRYAGPERRGTEQPEPKPRAEAPAPDAAMGQEEINVLLNPDSVPESDDDKEQ